MTAGEKVERVDHEAARRRHIEKAARSADAIDGGSTTPHNSLAECIDSCGMPTSTVSIPSRVAVIGPIVDPHGTLLRDTKT